MPPRLLTVCMGQEPASLFLYADSSAAARTVRQAIYDGPVDLVNFVPQAVILEKIPSIADGDVYFEPISVLAGNIIVDGVGKTIKLEEGVEYLPAGCHDSTCAQVFSGQDPIQIDQQVVRYKMKDGLQWSDGMPLTADDSLYSFELAQDYYPRFRTDLLVHTQSYQTLDAVTLEWRGLPGFREAGYALNFFTPLPRHAWGTLSSQDLLSSELANRAPIGWGPYIIDEWTSGDHISLHKNPNYFRIAEGLPAFDKLVFRFVGNPDAALDALLAGECDFMDETTMLETTRARLLELENTRRLDLFVIPSVAWEHLDFGINSLNPGLAPFFQLNETRQAVALCIDRQQMAEQLGFGLTMAPDSYIPAEHPLHNPQLQQYSYDPQAAAGLLDSVGWLDNDGLPTTPRVAQGVPGIQDGTPFEFDFLTTDEAEKVQVAQSIQGSLLQCGIKVDVVSMAWEALFAPGPEGPIFGRNYSMTQFGWASSVQPPCYLYTSQEIPGPYPDYSMGWGGANASGYSNPIFDGACWQASNSLPGDVQYLAGHYLAQEIYAQDLPSIPLYFRQRIAAARPDFCDPSQDSYTYNPLWNLEILDYGENCLQ